MFVALVLHNESLLERFIRLYQFGAIKSSPQEKIPQTVKMKRGFSIERVFLWADMRDV